MAYAVGYPCRIINDTNARAEGNVKLIDGSPITTTPVLSSIIDNDIILSIHFTSPGWGSYKQER